MGESEKTKRNGFNLLFLNQSLLRMSKIEHVCVCDKWHS